MESVEKRERTAPDEIPFEIYKLDIGGNFVQTFSGIALTIYDFCYVEIKYRRYPVINAVFLDKNGNTAILIEDNEYTLSTKTWDIEYVGNTLTFRNALSKIFTKLVFDAEAKTIKIKCDIKLKNNVRIKVKDDGIYADQRLLIKKCTVLESEVGLMITNDNQIDSSHFWGADMGNKISHCTVITDNPTASNPFIQGGWEVSNSIFQGIQGIAVLNCQASNNVSAKCRCAFAWTENYLSYLTQKFSK